jgi:hypothetical protein
VTSAVAVVLAISGCTPAERVHLAPRHPPPSRPACTGGDGEAVFRALLNDLNNGRQDIVSDYFTSADRFVRWIDPNAAQVLTELPDPADGHPSLDTLRDHLNGLAEGGFQVTAVSYTDLGYMHDALGEEGDMFRFVLRGRGNWEQSAANGGGIGTLDCATGRLRMIQINGW